MAEGSEKQELQVYVLSVDAAGSPDEGGLLRQIQRMLKAEIQMDAVKGFEPSRPIRLDAAPFRNSMTRDRAQ